MTVLFWIGVVVVFAILLKLLVLWAEPRLTFVPRREPTPAQPPFHAFALTTTDGTHLSGWRTDIPSEGPVFIYFCGNAGNLLDRTELLVGAAQAGMAVVSFNYRGTGESAGHNSEDNAYTDGELVHQYVVESLGVAPSRLILWGHSIGGAIAAEVALRRPCAGIVLEATFRSAHVMARRMLPFLPVKWLMRSRFDNEANIPRVQIPIFFIHGSSDLTIPPEDSRFLAAITSKPVDVWFVEGADHNDVYEVAGAEFYERLLRFGRQVFAPQSVTRTSP